MYYLFCVFLPHFPEAPGIPQLLALAQQPGAPPPPGAWRAASALANLAEWPELVAELREAGRRWEKKSYINVLVFLSFFVLGIGMEWDVMVWYVILGYGMVYCVPRCWYDSFCFCWEKDVKQTLLKGLGLSRGREASGFGVPETMGS